MNRALGRTRLAPAAGAALTVALLWLAVPAQAAQRYASPAGNGTSCTEVTPCSLETATQAAPGDEVIVEPGTYNTATELTVRANTSVHGRAGAPRPRLVTSAQFGITILAGATLSDFDVDHTNTSANIGTALYVQGIVDRVFVESTKDACSIARDGVVIRNTVCWSTGSDAFGVVYAVGAGSPQPVETGTLRNVTVFSQFGSGILVDAGDFAQLVIRATNTSVFGVANDIVTREGGTQGPLSATVILDHSIFQWVDVFDGGLVTPPGSPTNIEDAASRFVHFPDFHASPGAPTIDAGITSPANGPTDLDGRARAQGASTDIGAFEVPVAGAAAGGAGSGSFGAVSADRTNPVASKLDVQPDAFAALSGRGSSLISKKRKPAKGATVKYRLSEAATVTFTVERAVRGRKRKGRCVPGRRKGRSCTTYKKVKGSFTHAGKAGANSLRFSGRLARKPLRRGRYRLVGTARDAAGNKSKAVRTSFQIVRD